MKRLSDIPPAATERLVRQYKEEGGCIFYELHECVLKGQVVGERMYAPDGTLIMDTPLKDGQKHGREYTWDEDGALSLIEPYRAGLIHGTAKQYANGKVIGTYTFKHGTGLDLWRCVDENGQVFITEIHTLRQGLPHCYEWWLNADQRSVNHERHWLAGTGHGIERYWNEAGKLCRGYPKYWIKDQAVTKRQYLRAAQADKTLPPFREQDNLPRRQFPPEIKRLLTLPTKRQK